MAYMLPHYIVNQGHPSPVLDYVWDITRGGKDFQYDPTELIVKMLDATIRSKIALCIGVHEWIIWRYHHLSDDVRPFQIAEAAWCGNIESDYMIYYELPLGERGPIQSVLFNSMVCVGKVLKYTAEYKGEWADSLGYLVSMAMHILPDPKPFEEWLECVTDRLVLLYPAPEDDPYEDIFNDHEEERRGPLVAREALDPSFDYHPTQAPELLDNFLRNVWPISSGRIPTTNPFLRSPEELMELGIEHPYRVLPPESPEWRK
ncbi:MAG: hypothetical protein FWG14_14235 [Peptococcaceae bacterium]|nr:hypothetical protein [Peptococcaceae bacterium]